MAKAVAARSVDAVVDRARASNSRAARKAADAIDWMRAREPEPEEGEAQPEPEPEPEPEPPVRPKRDPDPAPEPEARWDGPPVRMYYKRGCPSTRAAFQLLQEREILHEAIDVTTDEATRSWLRVVTGRRTTPQIFIEGRPIGGYDDLRELDLDGELVRFVGTDRRDDF